MLTERMLLAALIGLVACNGASAPSPDAADAAALPDTRTGDRTRGDSPTTVDSRQVDGPAASLPETCIASCAAQSLTATFGAVTEPLERAVYGLDKDSLGKQGLYLEALHGGYSGCPQQSSPTPDRTLIVSGLPLPQTGAPLTKADGVAVTLLDFKGTLLKTAPMSKATAVTVTFRAAKVCPSCAGQPSPSDPDGFVALDLEATFTEGKVSGHLYAVHCDSLDN